MGKLRDMLQKLDEEFLYEKGPKVEVEHEGILDIPEGKSFNDMPISHFKNLMGKKGRAPVMRALLNLERWNKDRAGYEHIAKHARKVIDALKEEE
jgi:hypothetical protein